MQQAHGFRNSRGLEYGLGSISSLSDGIELERTNMNGPAVAKPYTLCAKDALVANRFNVSNVTGFNQNDQL